MCDGIEYLIDGEPQLSYFGEPGAQLAVRKPGGAIAFYRWGALHPEYFAQDRVPGWGAQFPPTGWAPLDEVRAGGWARLEPKPVRILASRFLRIDRWQQPRWFPLEPGHFIQGLSASIGRHERVYVVTVAPPARYAEEWSEWPRIVRAGGPKIAVPSAVT
jgi:hypothetical protein